MNKRLVCSLILTALTIIYFCAYGQRTILNSIRIGSTGNALGISAYNCHQVDFDTSLKTITFIHHNDPNIFPGTGIAQYRYDMSNNLGLNWISNIGPITTSSDIYNPYANWQTPQGLIFNPPGNLIADSAYLVQSEVLYNGSSTGGLSGLIWGTGKLSDDTAIFTVNIDTVNNANLGTEAGMYQSVPGTFWAMNVAFASSSNQIINGLVVQKGVWNNGTNNVDWTNNIIPQTFDSVPSGESMVSIFLSWSIAFDPSGQYGWMGGLGDITNSSVYQPILWKSVDGGNSWTGPINVFLDSMPEIISHVSDTALDGSPLFGIASTTYEMSLAVDTYGNPHVITTAGVSPTPYAVSIAPFTVWDFTYDTNVSRSYKWKGIHLADINTLRGEYSTDNPPLTEDNRPLVSRTPDGSKLFFFWLESDNNITGGGDNSMPNLFSRGIDVVQHTMTPLRNFTAGDTLWGGETDSTPGGIFLGAIFPQISTRVIVNGNTYNIPLVFTEIDYNHDPALSLGSELNPSAFWYVSNININASDFNLSIDSGVSITSIANPIIDKGITVKAFPNPFNNTTNITIQGLNEKYDFELYDVTGRLGRRLASLDTDHFVLNRENLASGIYFYRITTISGKGAFGKLVVE